jgi:hypothetical protein
MSEQTSCYLQRSGPTDERLLRVGELVAKQVYGFELNATINSSLVVQGCKITYLFKDHSYYPL